MTTKAVQLYALQVKQNNKLKEIARLKKEIQIIEQKFNNIKHIQEAQRTINLYKNQLNELNDRLIKLN